MKKIWIAVLVGLLGVGNLFAAPNPQELNKAIQQASSKGLASNKNAIDKNLRVDFHIAETLYDTSNDEYWRLGRYDADIACKAYALDSHWLLLSATCMDYSDGDVWEVGDHKHIERAERAILSSSISPLNYARNGHIMLIWTEQSNFSAPFVNVLATDSPKELFSLTANHIVQINTARFGTDAVKTRKLQTNSIDGNRFKLDEKWTDLSGTATDPLFLIAPNGNEFLAAYNAGKISYALQITFDDITHTYDGLASDTWFSLTKDDLGFIKKTVMENRPADWARIKNRLFFNNTSNAFFK